MTDTLEGADGVVARGVFVTRAVGALVDVNATVTAREADRTLGTTSYYVTHSVAIKTVAVKKTILSPSAALTCCNRAQRPHRLVVVSHKLTSCYAAEQLMFMFH